MILKVSAAALSHRLRESFYPKPQSCATTLIIISISLGYPTRSAAQSTAACPSGTYDMLDWMTLDSSLRATYHMEGTNLLYTIIQPGKFYWIKGGGGYPWEIQRYDTNYIQQTDGWSSYAGFSVLLRQSLELLIDVNTGHRDGSNPSLAAHSGTRDNAA